MLTWRLQPGLRGNRWRLTIREQRRRAGRLLAQNPSLQASLDAILNDAYGDARLISERETGLDESAFPPDCPWTFDDAMTGDLPGG